MSIKDIKQINPVDIIKGNMSEEEKFYLRSRGFDRAGNSPYKEDILAFINKLSDKKNKIRILEIGFGEGRLLLELKEIFPSCNIKLYGLNKHKECCMHSQTDLLENAKKFKISITRDNLPRLFFYDAGNGLKFKNNFFDLIISQTTFIYIEDKAKLIEEVYRVLKKNGRAYLQLDSTYRKFFKNRKYPFVYRKKSITPRFLIFKNKSLMSLSKLILKFKHMGFDLTVDMIDVKFKNIISTVLKIKKNSKNKLQMGLICKKTYCLNNGNNSERSVDERNYLAWNGTVSIYHSE